jgi:magnesium-transporting ATPase (P-type)
MLCTPTSLAPVAPVMRRLAVQVLTTLLPPLLQILNGIFQEIARKLNNKENHRTDTEYEDALIAKVFSFQFVNSFASLFYIGFVKPYIPTIDACVNLSCMTELQTTLGTIFLMRVTIGNVTELGTFFVVAALRCSCVRAVPTEC